MGRCLTQRFRAGLLTFAAKWCCRKSRPLQSLGLVEAVARLFGVAEIAVGNSHVFVGLDLQPGAGGKNDGSLVTLHSPYQITMLLVVKSNVEGTYRVDGMNSAARRKWAMASSVRLRFSSVPPRLSSAT